MYKVLSILPTRRTGIITLEEICSHLFNTFLKVFLGNIKQTIHQNRRHWKKFYSGWATRWICWTNWIWMQEERNPLWKKWNYCPHGVNHCPLFQRNFDPILCVSNIQSHLVDHWRILQLCSCHQPDINPIPCNSSLSNSKKSAQSSGYDCEQRSCHKIETR